MAWVRALLGLNLGVAFYSVLPSRLVALHAADANFFPSPGLSCPALSSNPKNHHLSSGVLLCLPEKCLHTQLNMWTADIPLEKCAWRRSWESCLSIRPLQTSCMQFFPNSKWPRDKPWVLEEELVYMVWEGLVERVLNPSPLEDLCYERTFQYSCFGVTWTPICNSISKL